MRVYFALCFDTFYSLCDQDRVKNKERPKEKPFLPFENDDNKVGLHLNIEENIKLTSYEESYLCFFLQYIYLYHV